MMEENLSRLKNILNTELKPGVRQMYSKEKSINTGEEIGNGVYFSPHFQVAMVYTTAVLI